MADILILMPDPDVRKQLSDLLAADRFQVIATGDAALGRALMRNAKFDVIIGDINFAAEDGIELVAHARRLLPEAGVIGVSGSSIARSATFKTYVHEMNVEYCFTLPFENRALLRTARNMIASRRKRARTSMIQQDEAVAPKAVGMR